MMMPLTDESVDARLDLVKVRGDQPFDCRNTAAVEVTPIDLIETVNDLLCLTRHSTDEDLDGRLEHRADIVLLRLQNMVNFMKMAAQNGNPSTNFNRKAQKMALVGRIALYSGAEHSQLAEDIVKDPDACMNSRVIMSSALKILEVISENAEFCIRRFHGLGKQPRVLEIVKSDDRPIELTNQQ
ncbi:hypothetical protein PG997_006145 [Apiospora hydei]|uniref:Uncharacterized protein n=1 Tax=Apiospora hydei TaxID=1337664 RepID=A0ABR1WRJ9_9PEZI